MIRTALDRDQRSVLAKSIWTYARPDSQDELGALKHFKIASKGSIPSPPAGTKDYEAIERFKNEVRALRENRPGLPKLLDSNEDGRWIVTELFREGALDRHIAKYRGRVVDALRAFRFLVSTVASLHEEGYVHRDIKPANVFLKNDDELILGDFGIVYMPEAADRLTKTNERVGPRDYMPAWADLGERLDKVHPNFDVYMLGKLLWCMIAGRMKLPREYHKLPQFDLAVQFPDERSMPLVNSILDKCLVEQPRLCLVSAKELLKIVDENLSMIKNSVPFIDGSGALVLPCRICGKGFYQDEGAQVRLQAYEGRQNMPLNVIYLRVFICNVCSHREFFAPGYPDEAAAAKWRSLPSLAR
jgi:serine/threonine protein kinase